MRQSDKYIKAYKDTFFNKKRVESGLRISDIADYLGVSLAGAGQYFTGAQMPPEGVIEKLCELFDVDILVGTRELKKDNKVWVAEHKRKMLYQATATKHNPEPPKQAELTPIVEEAEESVVEEIILDDIVVSNNKVAILSEDECKKILGLLYGNVDYDTYSQIAKMLID